jgi:hypothetical protein
VQAGGSGTDTVELSLTTTTVTLNLSTVFSQTVTPTLTMTLTGNIENGTGGAGNDSILGNSLDNILRGGGGNNTIGGAAGNDTIIIADPNGDNTVDGGGDYDLVVTNWHPTSGDNLNGNANGSQLIIQRTNLTPLQITGSNVEAINMDLGSGENTVTLTPLGGAGVNQITVGGGAQNDNIFITDPDGDYTVNGGAGYDSVLVRGGPNGDLMFVQAAGSQVEVNRTSPTPATVLASSVEHVHIDALAGNNAYTVAPMTGTGLIRLTLTGGPDNDTFTVNAGLLSRLVVNASAGANTLTISGGQFVLDTSGGAGGNNLDLLVSSAQVGFDVSQSFASLTISSGARVTLAPAGTRVLRTRNLSLDGRVNPTGTLDLNNNALIVDNSIPDGSTGGAEIASLISAAYNNGAWTLPGLTSSMADSGNFALGYAEASVIFSSCPASFFGQQVQPTDVVIRFTRYGDADLNATVNLNDFNRLAANFGQDSTLWTGGNFDYNTITNLNDFNRLAANFGQSVAAADSDDDVFV